MEKKAYEEPRLEIVIFETSDVITDSLIDTVTPMDN